MLKSKKLLKLSSLLEEKRYLWSQYCWV